MKLTAETETAFIKVLEEKGVQLEGNILKILEPTTDEFRSYVNDAIAAD